MLLGCIDHRAPVLNAGQAERPRVGGKAVVGRDPGVQRHVRRFDSDVGRRSFAESFMQDVTDPDRLCGRARRNGVGIGQVAVGRMGRNRFVALEVFGVRCHVRLRTV